MIDLTALPLLPCPWCRSRHVAFIKDRLASSKGRVECPSCGARGARNRKPAEAVDEWNILAGRRQE